MIRGGMCQFWNRGFLATGLLAAALLPFQSCTSTYTKDLSTEGRVVMGGTGADGGRIFTNYAVCPDSHVGRSTVISVALDGSSAVITRQGCVDLRVPRPISVAQLQYSKVDATVLQYNGQLFDQQLGTGGQKVTLQLCHGPGSSPVQAMVWQVIGNATALFGSVTQADGNGTGALNVIPPGGSSTDYVSATGQASQLDLNVGVSTLSYKIGAAALVNVSAMSCGTQPAPATVNDGSSAAPAGAAPHPGLLTSYKIRPAWKVAGVDYAVGPIFTPTLDPATISMSGVAVDTSARIVQINGNGITLDGYDFSLHGGYVVEVVGANAVISNSKFVIGTNTGIFMVFGGGSNLTVRYCSFDSSTSSSVDTIVSYTGTGLTLLYNWFKNYPNRVVGMGQSGTASLVYKYNLLEDGGMTGTHNFLQLGNGTLNSADVEFNTTYQLPQAEPGDGWEFTPATAGGGSAVSPTLAYNTMITSAGGGQAWYLVLGGGASGGGGIGHDNFFDLSGARTAFESGTMNGWTLYGNYDLVAGTALSNTP